jgi:predicted dienelactone hydrolase
MNPHLREIWRGFALSVTAIVMIAVFATLTAAVPVQLRTVPHQQQVPADPALPGRYKVGRITYALYRTVNGAQRPIQMDAWFPAKNTDGLPLSIIDLTITKMLSAQAVWGAEPADGLFPLILFSHGSDAVGFQSYRTMEHWASHGFIVLAPTFMGHDLASKVSGTTVTFGQTMNDRYFDSSVAINEAIGRFAGHVQMDGPLDPRVGVSGHSLGAVTALSLSSGLKQTFWQVDVPADPRVDAVLTVGPAMMFTVPNYGTTDPLLIVGGSADGVTPPVMSQQLWDASTGPKFRAEVVGATHAAPSEVCEFRDRIAVALWNDPTNQLTALVLNSVNGTAGGACDPGQPPASYVNNVFRSTSAAFWQTYLRRDWTYQTWLSAGRSARLDTSEGQVSYWRCFAASTDCATAS